MKKAFLFLAGALAIVTAACGGDDDSATTTARPTTTASALASQTAAATPSTAPSVTGEVGSYAPKTFTTEKFADTLTVTADTSWKVDYDAARWFALLHKGDTNSPSGAIDIFVPTTIYDETGINRLPVPSDLVSYIKGKSGLTVLDESPVSVGGLTGTQITVGNNTTDEFMLFDVADDNYPVPYADRAVYDILNGPTGQIFVAMHSTPPSQFDHFKPVAQAVLDTLQFQ
jgi:hypothetical protein